MPCWGSVDGVDCQGAAEGVGGSGEVGAALGSARQTQSLLNVRDYCSWSPVGVAEGCCVGCTLSLYAIGARGLRRRETRRSSDTGVRRVLRSCLHGLRAVSGALVVVWWRGGSVLRVASALRSLGGALVAQRWRDGLSLREERVDESISLASCLCAVVRWERY